MQDRKPIGTLTRQSDDVRLGLFATDEPAFPLLMVEEGESGGFDFSTAERLSFAEAFAILAQINKAAGTH